MPQNRNTADIPNYDTFPAAAPEWANQRTSGNWNTPPERGQKDNRLIARAEQIGDTLGNAVARVRELTGRIENIRGRFRRIRGNAQEDIADTAGQLRATAEQRLSQLRDNASRRVAGLRHAAARRVADARYRVDRVANERPLQFIAAAAGAAFLLGVTLRIWRSNRG